MVSDLERTSWPRSCRIRRGSPWRCRTSQRPGRELSHPMAQPTILLTHPPEMRALYYGSEATAALEQLGTVRLNEGTATLVGEALIEAAQGCRVIVSDRGTPGAAGLFAKAESLVAFVRCAMDVRNI